MGVATVFTTTVPSAFRHVKSEPSGGGGFDYASYSEASAGVTVTLASTAAQNTVGAGNDTLADVESLIGSLFGDHLTGNLADNELHGLDGNDILDGGVGDDTYVVSDATDYTYELAGEGSDRVRASITTTPRDNVENLVLTGSANLGGAGNGLDNVITGNAGANRLYGHDGNDTLYGNGGNDVFYGGLGTDHMYGGTGNDFYSVSEANDFVHEAAGEGTDTVYASIGYTLADNVERLYLIGTTAIDGAGNGGDNILVGNSAANLLSGGDGNDALYGFGGNDTLQGGPGIDKMYGGVGDDTYIVADSSDYAYEAAGAGTDTVLASVTASLRDNVETLVLTGSGAINGYGNDGANSLTGNAAANTLAARGGDDVVSGGGNDVLYGEAGNDVLAGGAGLDRAYGGAGADTFAFADGDLAGATATTCDIIHDFSSAEADRIDLAALEADTGLAGTQPFAFLGTAAFTGAAANSATSRSAPTPSSWATPTETPPPTS